jgi:hypothetical protein
VGSQRHNPAALPQEKTWYPLYRKVVGPQGRSRRVQKISPLQGLDPRTVQSVASSYTDWTIAVHARTAVAHQKAAWSSQMQFQGLWRFRTKKKFIRYVFEPSPRLSLYSCYDSTLIAVELKDNK